jgi:hypothetical protein
MSHFTRTTTAARTLRLAATSAFLVTAWAASADVWAAPAAPSAEESRRPRAGVVERFGADPLSGRSRAPFFGEGNVAGRFTFLASEPPHFPGDRRGTLRVLYDTTVEAARISTPIGQVLSAEEDFGFGAILTIRSERFAARPDGFDQIAFGLWNARTTGPGRTLFPSDSYDLMEFDYFANVTEFGGPFLSPTVFGGNSGGNAFNNLAFQSVELSLPFDEPLLCELRYEAATRRLTLRVSRHLRGARFAPVPGAEATVDLSRLNPGFLLDVAGIAGYFEGFPSLHAEVDYDLLYVGRLPEPFRVVPIGRPTPTGAVPEVR